MTTDTHAWPTADEMDGFYAWDNLHAPRVMTPMSGLVVEALGVGFTRAMTEYACSMGMRFRMINYYAFASFMPLTPQGETEAERRGRYKEILKDLVPNCGRWWGERWQPSLVPALDRARCADYASMSDDALVAEFDRQLEDNIDRWTVHGRINFVLIAASWFADFYNETFHPEEKNEAYQVLQGFETLSVQAGRDLWRLSRMVKSTPALMTLFEQKDATELLTALEASPAAETFLRELRTYLDQWGWRADAIFELSQPTWREDPSIPLNALQGYVGLGDEGDPERGYRNAVARREALLALAREKLQDDPEKLERFDYLYEAARWNLNLTEDHNYFIDQMGTQVLRLPILEMGRRLGAKGLIADQQDVFMLLVAEAKDSLRNGADCRSLVAQRKAEMEAWSKVVPPHVLGTPPPPPDNLEDADPFEEAMLNKMLGVVRGPEPSRDADVFNGVPASSGTVQGIAKVVRSLSEASKLQPGDIMVCEMTMPPWTPLFSTVAAVVADTGGILSHCAIVAREYHLPAVVGTQVGTKMIQDGWTVTVDGTRGVVRIDSRG